MANYDWDEAGALKRINGNATLLKKLLTIYRESSEQLLSEIDAARLVKDHIKLVNAAHALKGVAGNLSAAVVAENAREVEVLASNPEWAVLDEAISQLKTSSHRLLKLFAEYVEG